MITDLRVAPKIVASLTHLKNTHTGGKTGVCLHWILRRTITLEFSLILNLFQRERELRKLASFSIGKEQLPTDCGGHLLCHPSIPPYPQI